MDKLAELDLRIAELLECYDEKKNNPVYKLQMAFLLSERRRVLSIENKQMKIDK